VPAVEVTPMATNRLSPEVLEPVRRQLGVAHGVLDVFVAEPRLQCPCVVAGISKRVAATVPQHGGPGVNTHKGRSWGGSRERVTRHLLPWRGADPRRDVLRLSAAPAPTPDRIPVAPSHLGLNEPQFPLVRRAPLENREIAAVLERGAGLITVARLSNGFSKKLDCHLAAVPIVNMIALRLQATTRRGKLIVPFAGGSVAT
jgi:hypothetical protein